MSLLVMRLDAANLPGVPVATERDEATLQNMRDGLRNWGVLAGNVQTETFGSLEAAGLEPVIPA